MNAPILTDALLHVDGRIATLTLNRHDVRNALTGTRLIDDIVTVAEWVNRTDAVSALIITAVGSAFSAGGNVKDMAERGGDFAGDAAEVAARYRRGIQRIPLALQQIEVPVIAAVNGPAIGAGFDLANMADRSRRPLHDWERLAGERWAGERWTGATGSPSRRRGRAFPRPGSAKP